LEGTPRGHLVQPPAASLPDVLYNVFGNSFSSLEISLLTHWDQISCIILMGMGFLKDLTSQAFPAYEDLGNVFAIRLETLDFALMQLSNTQLCVCEGHTHGRKGDGTLTTTL